MTTRRQLRILCVDDHAFLAEGMKSRLAMEADMQLVEWLESADGLPEAVNRHRPDVVLLDIEMPGSDPFEILQDVGRRFPEVRVIMLSAYVRDHYIDQAVKAGAWGYLSKSDRPERVVAAIRKVADGEFAFGPEVLERCRPAGVAGGTQTPSSKLGQLTGRELQILRMLGKGMSRIEIAETIHRSPKTIDNHRAAIMTKLGIHDRVELARYAVREGLVEA